MGEPSRWGVWGGAIAAVASILVAAVMSGLTFLMGLFLVMPFGFVLSAFGVALWMGLASLYVALVVAALISPGVAFSRWTAALSILLALGGSGGGCWAGLEAAKEASDNVGKAPHSGTTR